MVTHNPELAATDRTIHIRDGTIADRQQRLNSMLRKLVRLAEIFNIAIDITIRCALQEISIVIKFYYIIISNNMRLRLAINGFGRI